LKLSYQLGITPPINNEDQLSGIVEIDETLMTHHEGQQMWTFGIFDRVTKELRCFCVPDRTSQTLIPIIKEHVGPGSRIYSDGWAAYNTITNEGYDRIVVPHVNGFGSGENTTNGIESCWSEIKRLTNQSRGIQLSQEDALGDLQDHVNVGVWRRLYKDANLVDELAFIMKLYYA